MVCENHTQPVYPIVFQHPGLPVCGQHSIFNFINLATRMCVKSEEEGPGENNHLQYFEFVLKYLVQPLGQSYIQHL